MQKKTTTHLEAIKRMNERGWACFRFFINLAKKIFKFVSNEKINYDIIRERRLLRFHIHTISGKNLAEFFSNTHEDESATVTRCS